MDTMEEEEEDPDSRRVSTDAEDIRKIFDVYDQDGDGFLDRTVVESVLQGFNQRIYGNELTNASNAYGQVCHEAFISLFAVRMTARLSKDIKEALKDREYDENYKLDLEDFDSDKVRRLFRVFDKDGDGFISTAELRHVTSMVGEKLSAEELDAMMNEADLDKDGRIGFDEFGLMLIRHNHGH